MENYQLNDWVIQAISEHKIPLHLFPWVLSCVPLFLTPWTVARQPPLSMGFSRQYWRGLPLPPPGESSCTGIKPAFPASPALPGGFLTAASGLLYFLLETLYSFQGLSLEFFCYIYSFILSDTIVNEIVLILLLYYSLLLHRNVVDFCALILPSVTLWAYLLRVWFLKISYMKIILSLNKDSFYFFLSFLCAFSFFSYLIALTRNSSTPTWSSESKLFAMSLSLWKTLQPFTINHDAGCWLFSFCGNAFY